MIFAFSLIDNAARSQANTTAFEVLVDEWGTLPNLGGKRHPTMGLLLELLVFIDNIRAACYVAKDMMGCECLQPIRTFWIRSTYNMPVVSGRDYGREQKTIPGPASATEIGRRISGDDDVKPNGAGGRRRLLRLQFGDRGGDGQHRRRGL